MLGVVLVAVLVSTPWLYARIARTWRWRQVPTAADAQIATAEAAWAELREAVRDAGLRWDPAETPRAAGARLVIDADLDDEGRASLDRLVAATERARYAPRADRTPTLQADATRVRHDLVGEAPTAIRIRAFLCPSRLRDAATEANRAVTAGFDWLDTSGARARAAVNRQWERGMRSRS